MKRRTKITVALLGVLCSCAAFAQGDSILSPYEGHRPVDSPEALSGLWEAPDGSGGAVGIHLMLTTTVPVSADTLGSAQQLWERLEVGVYERKGPDIQFGDQSYFGDSPSAGNVAFDEGVLRLHFASPWKDTPSVDLDLRQTGDTWVGRLHRGYFDANVILRRPGAGGTAKTSPIGGTSITGTWISTPGPFGTCVHVAGETPGSLAGWSDSVGMTGHQQVVAGMSPITGGGGRYGELMWVKQLDGGKNLPGALCGKRGRNST